MILVILFLSQNSLAEVQCEMKLQFAESSDIYPFKLASLPYPNEFLDPVLSSQLLYLHHDFHHQSYVDKLNTYVKSVDKYQDNTLVELVDLSRDDTSLQKYAGGHYNHLLYWWSITNSKCAAKEPTEELLDLINATWGNLTVFKNEFQNTSLNLIGSGWVWLCVNAEGELEIRSTENEINPLMEVSGDLCVPILGNNIWEHAYYLKYMWDRKSYIDEFWGLIDWELVSYFYDVYASSTKSIPL